MNKRKIKRKQVPGVTDPNVNKGRAGGQTTSLGLLARVKAHEQGSWDKLVGLYSPLIYHWCRRAGLQAVDAEDVGQEVFRSVFRKIGTYRHDQKGNTFRGWLRTITQKKVLDFYKRVNRQPPARGGSDALHLLEALPADPASNPGNDPATTTAAADEKTILFRQALKQLEAEFTEQTWQAFWRVVAGGQTPGDVASQLGITVNVVYLAKSRVLRRFREEFADLVDPGSPL